MNRCKKLEGRKGKILAAPYLISMFPIRRVGTSLQKHNLQSKSSQTIPGDQKIVSLS